MYYLGIDLHKRTSVMVLIDESKKILWQQSTSAHPDNIITSLARLSFQPSEISVAMEPVCGWRSVHTLLNQSGYDIHIAHPGKVRLIAESKQKHDKGDALILADLLRANMLPESYRIDDSTYELRTLLRHRTHLVNLRTSIKNHIHGITTTQGLYGLNPLSKKGQEYIQEHSGLGLQVMQGTITDMDTRILPLTRSLLENSKKYPIIELFQSIPGVGLLTACTVYAEVGDFSRFSSPEKLAAFAGLVPRQRSSGSSVRMGSITRTGSSTLRTTLVEASMRIRQTNAPELYAVLQRLVDNGVSRKKARVALARKLLTIMWSMAIHNQRYQSQKIIDPSYCITKVTSMDPLKL